MQGPVQREASTCRWPMEPAEEKNTSSLPPAIATASAAKPISQRRQAKRQRATRMAPTRMQHLEDGVEVSLHEVPLSLHTECCLVYPSLREHIRAAKMARQAAAPGTARQLLAIPTFHVAAFDIMHRNDDTEAERARVFARFAHLANIYCTLLRRHDPDAFADFSDLEGIASLTESTGTVFDEVSSARALLGYKVVPYMGVPIVHHPVLGSNRLCVHTIILHARLNDALHLLKQFVQEYKVGAGRGCLSAAALLLQQQDAPERNPQSVDDM